MVKEYYSILENCEYELVEKKSRFISNLIYVETEEEAKQKINEIKKKFHDAKHNVFAYRVFENGRIIDKYSDDGEPSGTAGRPMLAVLKGSGLTNVIVTAARWFGGTKLGTGGLVRAYSDCARLALENALTCELIPMERFGIVIPYSFYEQIKRLLGTRGYTVLSEEFGAAVTIQGEISAGEAPLLKTELSELTCAQCRFLSC
jgi:uncharacterized YigZ family protein